MKYARILAEIASEPLAITPAKLAAVMGLLRANYQGPDFAAEAPETEAAFAVQPWEGQQVGGSIMVIPIDRSLAHRDADAGSGVQSYESIENRLADAMADPDVGGVMLDVNSHGGQAVGMYELATRIRSWNAEKPIHAIARGNAYSAAYGLLSAAGRATVIPSGGVGSIGVIAVHADRSAMNEKMGVKYTAVYSGEKKNQFSGDAPLAEADRAELQARVDGMRDDFAALVADHRGLSVADVLATEAGIFYGQEAVDAGLVDAVETWDQAVAALATAMGRRENHSAQGVRTMNTRQRFETLIENNADAVDALAAIGYVRRDAAAEADAIEAAVHRGREESMSMAEDAIKERMAAVDAVLAACELGRVDVATARAHVSSGLDAQAVASAIIAARVRVDGGQAINGAVGADNLGEHELIASVKKSNAMASARR